MSQEHKTIIRRFITETWHKGNLNEQVWLCRSPDSSNGWPG
jgi:hypothetical protein